MREKYESKNKMVSEQDIKPRSVTAECEPPSADFLTDANSGYTLNGARVVMAEFQGGQPWAIHTTESGKGFDHYDIEESKSRGYWCYHMSGGGPNLIVDDCEYWVAEDFARHVRGYQRSTGDVAPADLSKRLVELPLDLQTFIDDMVDTDTAYCGTCKDMLPTDDLCSHIWWCDECGWWSIPSERCSHKREIA